MDYPDWVFQGVLFANWLAGHPVSGYVLKHYPVPNTTSTVGIGALTLAFGWNMAARIWLVLTLVISLIISLYLGRVFAVREAALWFVLPSVLFFNHGFWLGTANFSLGTAFLLLLAGLFYQGKERLGPVIALLLLCFFTHLIVYAAAILLIFCYCLQHRRWRLAYSVIATVPLALWYIAGRILTHSPESHVAASSISHTSIPVVLALMLLFGNLFWNTWTIVRVASLFLAPLVLLLLVAALLTGLGVSHASSALDLLQIKAMSPFQLLGFTDFISTSGDDRVSSSTMTLIGHTGIIALIAFDLVAGLLLFGAIVRHLSSSNQSQRDPGFFLWNFVALFAFVFLVCPPNALAVVSIDLRIAQLFFTPALFLLARERRVAIRLAALPLAVLLVVNAWQFTISQDQGSIPAIPSRLPGRWATFGGVDPTVRLGIYRHLKNGQMTEEIFPTALFLQQKR